MRRACLCPCFLHSQHSASQVEALRASDTQQVLPWLVELLEGGQQQRATKLREVSSDLQHFWEMPAQHLLPGTKRECRRTE